jgi:hypothetical protein
MNKSMQRAVGHDSGKVAMAGAKPAADSYSQQHAPSIYSGRAGARHQRNSNRIEHEIVQQQIAPGMPSERYPLAGASRFRGSGHDIDLYTFGEDEAPLVSEAKSRKRGNGFITLESWLADYDALILRRNNADPLFCVPWRVWARLLQRVRR